MDGYDRQCPGENYRISEPICAQRRRHHYPKCPGCRWNPSTTAVSVSAAAGSLNEPVSLERLFMAYDIRGRYPGELTLDLAWKIGHAVAQFLRMNLSGLAKADPRINTVLVGRDTRQSGPEITQALVDGILSTGTHVLDLGVIDTPQIYFAINHMGCCGGIQTTASHHPANFNGFKISGAQARPIGEQTGLQEIKRIVAALRRNPPALRGRVETHDLTATYREHVLGFLKLSRRLKVVVDVSNGAAARFLPTLFMDHPLLEIVALNMELDQGFHHPPNPLDPANLQELQEAVLSHAADVGICFDGDADRCILVDEQARIIGCDLITALLAREFLRQSPGSTVVYDLRSSRVVREEIQNAGGQPKRERVGHAFMKKSLADSKGVFGGELSGHYYFRDNFYCDSGAIAMACVLTVLSNYDIPMSHILKPLRRWHSSGELNFEVPDADRLLRALVERCRGGTIDQLDGLTVDFETWWFNLRKSNTEPVVRLTVEANTAELLGRRTEELRQLIQGRSR